jgi:UDPglucose 6-dehydrogenase
MTPGCDISDVRKIMESDNRIGSKFLQCSLGFGGSCFDKDIKSLVYILASNKMVESALYWQGVLDINQRQKARLAELVIQNEQSGTKLAIFGLSYKKDTSDTRETPVALIISNLLASGFKLSLHDPQVSPVGFEAELELQTTRNFTNSPDMEFCGNDTERCATGADAILVMTEWDCFKTYNYDAIAPLMRQKTIYDFRCFMDQKLLISRSFDRAFQLGVGWLPRDL